LPLARREIKREREHHTRAHQVIDAQNRARAACNKRVPTNGTVRCVKSDANNKAAEFLFLEEAFTL